MARIKNVEAFCNVCNTVRKMEITGEIEGEESKKWAKCKKCKQTMIIELVEKQKEEPPSLEGIENNFQEYSPIKTFEIGQAIYHKSWDDFGVILSKNVLSNGKSSITVEFKKLGTKQLIESIKQ